MTPIETPRLILREWTIDDAEALFQLNSDPAVIRYTGDDHFESVEHSRELIRNYDHYQVHGMGRWLTTLKDGTVLGWCGLKNHPEEGVVDLGYRFFRRYWGQGYASEAGEASLRHGFEGLNLPEIVGHAMVENTASYRVMEKLNMTFVSKSICGGEPAVLYKITRDQWLQLQS